LTTNKKIIIYIFTVIVLCCIGGLLFRSNLHLLVSTHSIIVNTTKEIVFQSWSKDIDYGHDGSVIFMQSDGSGITKQPINVWNIFFTWSPNKQNLLSIYSFSGIQYTTYGYLNLDDNSTLCNPHLFYYRQQWVDEKTILTYVAEVNSDGKRINNKIVLWDIHSCSILKTVYEEDTDDIILESEISIRGDLVFTREKYDDQKNRRVNIINKENNSIMDVGIGLGASWSPDGNYIVYTGINGIVVYNNRDRTSRDVINLSRYYSKKGNIVIWDDKPPMARWSPDMKYIIYHRRNNNDYVIVKLNLDTLTEQILFIGGIYPDWK
jgi:hypothetical protein